MKPWYKSRAVWFNVIVAAAGALVAIPNLLPAWGYAIATVIVAVVNVLIRFDTDTAIAPPSL